MKETPRFLRGALSRRNFLRTCAAGMMTASPHARGLFAAPSTDTFTEKDFASLGNTHDLTALSPWGPYSKKFYGISHIPDISAGLLFDLSIFPVLEGADARLPNVTDRCGVHPWEAAPDLAYYTTRTELLWKDQVYCDFSYIEADVSGRLLRIELVNNTATSQRVTLHGLSQLCFPPLHELTAEPIRLCDVSLPSTGIWIDALDYEDMRFATPRPTDNLVTEGRWRGEERGHDTVGGSVLAQGFGRNAGDTVLYTIKLPHAIDDAGIVVRFHGERGQSVSFSCTGLVESALKLDGTGDFSVATLAAGALPAGEHILRLTSIGGDSVALNGFAIVHRNDISAVGFPARPWHPEPKIEEGTNNSLLLKYADIDPWYGFTLAEPSAPPKLVEWRDLDQTFNMQSSPNTQDRIFGHGNGRPGDPASLFVHTSWPSVELAAQSRHTLFGFVCTGSKAQVKAAMQSFDAHSTKHMNDWQMARKRAFQFRSNPGGEPYREGQQLLAATTITNVVYPLRTQRQTIRHYSPGKIWDCLYTWDAGFIGLGLLELDVNAAIEELNAYLTPPGSQSAFIHHGTPLPTQHYLFFEIWNRTHSHALLRYFYPRLRQYYLFLAGRSGSSTTRHHSNGLISTWDYFYNTGGWDDYPPQVYVHKHKLEASTVPAVSTSHIIRSAKLLRLAARELGAEADISEYETDIRELAEALQHDAWDEASGYFGYATYNRAGAPSGILRTETGVNFNMGLDGVSPLIAGICSETQQQAILDRLFSEKHLWTAAGITTVDKTAPYYNPGGYWNGSVWFAHQWFLFKTMLDLKRGDLAVKIAQTGLDIWQKSVESSYDCMEHFSPQPPYGAGWCEFSSLSSPALSWFTALYTPGRMTAGFDTWIRRSTYQEHTNTLRAVLSIDQSASGASDLLVCLRPGRTYEVTWNRERIASTEFLPGLLRITIPQTRGILLARSR